MIASLARVGHSQSPTGFLPPERIMRRESSLSETSQGTAVKSELLSELWEKGTLTLHDLSTEFWTELAPRSYEHPRLISKGLP